MRLFRRSLSGKKKWHARALLIDPHKTRITIDENQTEIPQLNLTNFFDGLLEGSANCDPHLLERIFNPDLASESEGKEKASSHFASDDVTR